MDRREILRDLAFKCAEALINNYKVKRIFLIGSLVKGYVHSKSDIDMVIEGLSPYLYIKALTELYEILLPGIELNLIPFEDAYESLKEKTIKEGELIYG